MQDATTIAVSAPERAESAGRERLRLIVRNIFPFAVVGGIWEIIARAGVFPRRLFPTLEDVASSFVQLTISGILPHHAIDTIIRLLSGFALAGIFGVTIGVLMARSRRAEDIFLPLVSICAPIPGLAYAPLFLLWFGLGNLSSVRISCPSTLWWNVSRFFRLHHPLAGVPNPSSRVPRCPFSHSEFGNYC